MPDTRTQRTIDQVRDHATKTERDRCIAALMREDPEALIEDGHFIEEHLRLAIETYRGCVHLHDPRKEAQMPEIGWLIEHRNTNPHQAAVARAALNRDSQASADLPKSEPST